MSSAFRIPTLVVAIVLLAAGGCASKVLVPPRVDLAEWGTIGIVEFDSGSAPELANFATGQFVQMLHEAQPGARILELGSEQQLLAVIDRNELDFEAVRAMGERFRVDAIFTGSLELSSVKPRVRFDEALTSMRAAADVDGRLATRLLETRSGATVWSRSARAAANVARVGMPHRGGLPSFRVNDPDDVYAGLVPQLVARLRHDFYPTWQKQ